MHEFSKVRYDDISTFVNFIFLNLMADHPQLPKPASLMSLFYHYPYFYCNSHVGHIRQCLRPGVCWGGPAPPPTVLCPSDLVSWRLMFREFCYGFILTCYLVILRSVFVPGVWFGVLSTLLDTCELPSLNQEGVESLNRPMSIRRVKPRSETGQDTRARTWQVPWGIPGNSTKRSEKK